MTFRQWLMQHLKDSSALGDLAREFKADRCMRARTEQGQRAHLEEHGAIPAALEVHAAAWQQYREQSTA